MQNEHDDTWDLPGEAVGADSAATGRQQPTAQDVTAALMSADNDVELPGNSRPASVTSNLLALKVGDNFTRSFCLPKHFTLAEVEQNMMKWKADLRSSLNQGIRNAKRVDSREFVMESAHTTTSKGVVYVQVIVTRTA